MYLLVWGTTLICVAGTLVLLILRPRNAGFQIIHYILFLLSAGLLGVSVYLVARFAKTDYKKLKSNNKLVKRFSEDFEFRTLVLGVGSFIFTVVYASFNGLISAVQRSVWYGALAAYYAVLAFSRGGALLRRRQGVRRGVSARELERRDATTFCFSGILLIILTFAMSAMAVQMIRDDQTRNHFLGVAVIGSAVYTVLKMVFGVRNFVKAKKSGNYTVMAIRNINAADALVALFSLQTAMLKVYSTDGTELNPHIFNIITGTVVAALILILGAYMIVKGRARIKELKEPEVPSGGGEDRDGNNSL